MKTGMVFGVFDGLHEGHKNFFSQALKKCDRLIVVVTVPEIIKTLKKRAPRFSYEERVVAIRSLDSELVIIPSDVKLNSWNVLRDHKPDIVFLGYDQQGIAPELEKLNVPFIFLEPYKPDEFKSSKLNSPG